MPREYDMHRADGDSHHLLTPDAITRAQGEAIEYASRCVAGVEDYCKSLSAHFDFVVKNVEWDQGVRIVKALPIKHTPFGKIEYYITTYRVPIVHGEMLRYAMRERYKYRFDGRNRVRATASFLTHIALAQPRYIEIDLPCVDEIRRQVNKRQEYSNLTIRNYRLVDVVNAACDGTEAAGNSWYVFDVEMV